MGAGAVSALSFQAVTEPVGGSHAGAGLHGDGAALHAAPEMNAQGGVHALKAAGLHHVVGSGAQLLGGLEDEPHRSGELIPAGDEDFRRAQQGGGVAVVAAGVHQAVGLGFKGAVDQLLDV